MTQPVASAARRYVEATTFDSATTGMFFASKPKKMVGPLQRNQQGHFDNPEAQ